MSPLYRGTLPRQYPYTRITDAELRQGSRWNHQFRNFGDDLLYSTFVGSSNKTRTRRARRLKANLNKVTMSEQAVGNLENLPIFGYYRTHCRRTQGLVYLCSLAFSSGSRFARAISRPQALSIWDTSFVFPAPAVELPTSNLFLKVAPGDLRALHNDFDNWNPRAPHMTWITDDDE